MVVCSNLDWVPQYGREMHQSIRESFDVVDGCSDADIGRRRRGNSGVFRQINCRLDVPLARLRSRTDETGGIGHVPDWLVSADILFGADNPRMFGFSREQICGICSSRIPLPLLLRHPVSPRVEPRH